MSILPPAAPHPTNGLRFNSIALAVSDLDTMIHWYESVLDFRLLRRGHFGMVGADFALLEIDGLCLELVTRAGDTEKRPVDRTAPPLHLDVLGWKALVLETDALEDVTARLIGHDVEVLWAKETLVEGLRSTMLRDPEGNLVHVLGIASQPIPPKQSGHI